MVIPMDRESLPELRAAPPIERSVAPSVAPSDEPPDAVADGPGTERMFTALYDELHRLAERQLRRHGRELSLGASTLLHEAYLAVSGSEASFPDRARFMGYAARAMRGLIIDHARRSWAQKRGGGAAAVTLPPDAHAVAALDGIELEALGDALEELAAFQSGLAELVDLHFFAGLQFVEIAALRGVSERTVQRDWRKARLFLHQALADGGSTGGA